MSVCDFVFGVMIRSDAFVGRVGICVQIHAHNCASGRMALVACTFMFASAYGVRDSLYTRAFLSRAARGSSGSHPSCLH